MDMRGLSNFIKDIRKCATNREDEERRINIELAKIRSKFKESASLSSYDRKKYVCKLMFIYMLGYEVDFGHMEGLQLLSGSSQSEKLIGYLMVTVFLHENHELLTLTTHTVNLDLVSGKEYNMCLALTAIANIGGRDFAEAMTHHIQQVCGDKSFSTLVRKKALLTMLRMHRKYREIVDTTSLAGVCTKSLRDHDFGVITCALSLMTGLMSGEIDDGGEGVLDDVPVVCMEEGGGGGKRRDASKRCHRQQKKGKNNQ